MELLTEEINFRVKRYSYCIAKCTDNYIKWLQEDYKIKLRSNLERKFIDTEQNLEE
jgi:hypothetical protein